MVFVMGIRLIRILIFNLRMMKIVFLDAITLNPGDIDWKPLTDLGNVTFYDRTSPEQIIDRAKDAEIVLVNKVKLNETHFKALPDLKYVGVTATGFDIIDIAAANQYNITVTNVKGYSSDSVAQHTFALLLELVSKVGMHNESVQQGEWQSCPDFCYWKSPLTELSGKTMGLIGLGGIGEKVAAIALAFGMKVLVHRRNTEPVGIDIEYTDLDTLFRKSDVVSLHCPLTEHTRGIINHDNLTKMKPTSYLINTARGGLVNEQDLAEALKSNIIAGAGLDVLSTEPPVNGNPLINVARCVISPHQAWASTEARQRLLAWTVDNIIAFKDGNPVNVVN